VLIAASMLPLIYMGFFDGWGYDRGGLAGSFMTDAFLSITACSLLAWLLLGRSRWHGQP